MRHFLKGGLHREFLTYTTPWFLATAIGKYKKNIELALLGSLEQVCKLAFIGVHVFIIS